MSAFLLPAAFAVLAFGLIYFLTQGMAPQKRMAFLIAVPLFSFALYLLVGSPALEGRAQAELLERDRFNPQALTALIENKLAEDPNHYDGWQTLGFIHLTLRRFYQAQESFLRADKLRPNQTATLLGLARAKFYAAGGLMSEDTLALVRKVLREDKNNVSALYLLAQGALQDGKMKQAKRTLRRALRLAKKQSFPALQQEVQKALDKIQN